MRTENLPITPFWWCSCLYGLLLYDVEFDQWIGSAELSKDFVAFVSSYVDVGFDAIILNTPHEKIKLARIILDENFFYFRDKYNGCTSTICSVERDILAQERK